MNVEQYRKRFYNLMESTMGDVKPILNEGPLSQEGNPEGSKVFSISLTNPIQLSQLKTNLGQTFNFPNFIWDFGPDYTKDKIKKSISFNSSNLPKGTISVFYANKKYDSRDGGPFTDYSKPKPQTNTQSGPPEFNITDKVLLAAIDGGAFEGKTIKKTQLNGRDAIFVASQKNPGQSVYYFGDYKKYRYNTLIPGPNEQPIETMTWTYTPR